MFIDRHALPPAPGHATATFAVDCPGVLSRPRPAGNPQFAHDLDD